MNSPKVAMFLSRSDFSRYFPREDYLDGTVITYLKYLGIDYVGFYECVCWSL